MSKTHELPHSDLTSTIIGCCFELIDELGAGFLENVYKNALFYLIQQKGLQVATEQQFDVLFRQHKVGRYVADIIVDSTVIIELKCVKSLLPEHQAQLINYLKVSNIPVGLLVNFGNKKLDYKRVEHPNLFTSTRT